MPLFNGICTGLLLQIAIGPVFFYVLGITLESGFANGFSGILGVTIADYLYIFLSLYGLGRLLKRENIRKKLIAFSFIALLLFGSMLIVKGIFLINNYQLSFVRWNIYKSFFSCFIITISSPITVLFWTSVLTLKAEKFNYRANQLAVFGIGAGLSTILFFTITMAFFGFIQARIPIIIIKMSNIVIGIILILYAVQRVLKSNKIKTENKIEEKNEKQTGNCSI